jgi:hypothetical protein
VTTHGCDSVEILHLTINNSSTQEYHKTAFVSYTWKEGKTYSQSGVYYDSLSTINGCDSIDILYLNILPPTEYFVYDTLLCHGVTCEWRNKQLTTEGTYNDTVKNQLDCDSVIYILNLEYLPDVVFVEEDTLLCHGITCNWRGLELDTAGTYNDTVKNQLDCDSVIYILNIEYLPDVVFVEEDTLLCHGVTCEWRNKPYTTAGSYNDTVRNMLLCDSIIYTLNLQYLPEVQHFTTDTAICYGFACTWRDYTYDVSGTYHDTIRNILHCDSIIYTLNLLIYPEIPITHVTDTMAGPEYHWNEQIYTTGGEYSVILPAVTGCDSVVVLHLLTNHATIDTVILYEQCAGSGEQEIKIYTRGFIDSLAIHYSPKAKDAGWNDTVMSIATDNIYTIPYHDIRAGIYKVDLIALFHQEEVAHYNFHLTYLYPNTIFEQRYNDLIVLLTADYNGGYDFATFQWYKDGQPIWGETHSYLNQSLSFHSEYSVLLTDSTGLTLMSCPIIPENKAEYLVYPTIVNKGGTITCATLEECELYLYDYSGNRIHQELTQKGETLISSPCVSGIYMLRMVMPDHTERTFRIIVL